jgi:hypothetical protein
VKKFKLGTVLSITTGTLFGSIDDVYEILNYMTDDNLFTHALPRASKICKPCLLKQFPQLESVNTDNVGNANWKSFLEKQIEKFGLWFLVDSLAEQKIAYEKKNPIVELSDMMDKR